MLCQAQSMVSPPERNGIISMAPCFGPGMTTIEVMNEDTLIGTWTYSKLLSTTIGEFLGTIDKNTEKETMYVIEDNQVVYGRDRFLGGIFLDDFNEAPGDTLPSCLLVD